MDHRRTTAGGRAAAVAAADGEAWWGGGGEARRSGGDAVAHTNSSGRVTGAAPPPTRLTARCCCPLHRASAPPCTHTHNFSLSCAHARAKRNCKSTPQRYMCISNKSPIEQKSYFLEKSQKSISSRNLKREKTNDMMYPGTAKQSKARQKTKNKNSKRPYTLPYFMHSLYPTRLRYQCYSCLPWPRPLGLSSYPYAYPPPLPSLPPPPPLPLQISHTSKPLT